MKKKSTPKERDFIIMNEDGEFYVGIIYGQLAWSTDRKEAKPFDDLAKFEGMKRWYPQKEIVYDYV